MHIGIDCRMYNQSGVGRYIRNLIEKLGKLDNKNQYYLFLLSEDYNNLRFKKNFHKVRVNFNWYSLKEQIFFPHILSSYKLDLMHFPHFNVPIFYKGKFIVTIHDLIHQHFQMRKATTQDPLTYNIKQLGYKKVSGHAVKNSIVIITPSHFVKEQLASEWGVDLNKVIVTPEAVDDKIITIANKMSREYAQNILKRFSITPPFLFYVGNAHPHKNIERLIETFLELRKNYQYLTLVLSGHDHYFWKKIREQYKHKDIIYTGYVTDEELVALYKSAKAYVFPSLEEGFGIPLLEAMACGCPVASSNRGSLKEVGDDAAIYFNPKDTTDMLEKIRLVIDNNKLRSELIEKGNKRHKRFSWETLAEKTLEVYTK